MLRRRLTTITAAAVLAGGAAVVAPGANAGKTARAAQDDRPVVGAPALDARGCARIPRRLEQFSEWPRVKDPIRTSASLERRVQQLVSRMSLEEKVGQMTQPEIASITPAEVRQYNIGTVLNGGGSWPGGSKRASPRDWLGLADAYWQASRESSAGIPVIWGTDAVHGHSNVFRATLFPHNIGLGATRNPCLIRQIGRATAHQVRATGQDWAFAPTVAVPEDDRWGRTYEGFSEDPRVQRAYGYEAVRGLQTPSGKGQDGVLATAKHWIGDGGTIGGRDQGVNDASEDEMRNVHAQGYYGALAAGSHTVMVSFNSWTNLELGINEGKLHGSKYAVQGILKDELGFDGLVVSDWNGIGQVAGCTNSSCPQAVNAGIDVFMVPQEWKAFIENTVAQVQAGEIPMARIDDAVSRILRVKLASGVFEMPKPSKRRRAGSFAALDAKRLAAKAVRESLVLLKNNDDALPLPRRSKVLVVGKSADSLQNQTGGWSLTWQGMGNSNADFPNGTTVLEGLRMVFGRGNVTFHETGANANPADYDAVVAVIGETPYAEGVGDLPARRTLEFGRLYPGDRGVLERVSGKGAPVITVFESGRPLYVNRELNLSDAFIAAWLPGTEGFGVAQMLVKGAPAFRGRLPFSWPKEPCQSPVNLGDEAYEPLFGVGYGLTTRSNAQVGELPVDTTTTRCDGGGGGGPATEELELFVRQDVDPYNSFIGSPVNWGQVLSDDPSAVDEQPNISARTSDVNVQQDARRIKWNGTGPGQFYLQSPETADLSGWLNANGALVFDTIVHQGPTARTVISMHCVYPCFSEVEATGLFRRLEGQGRQTVKIPLSCLDTGGLDFGAVNTPFLVYTEGAMEASFANVRWVPQAAGDADALGCDELP